MSQLNDEWIQTIINLPLQYQPRHIASVQRMYQHLEFHYKGPWDLTLEETGYSQSKLRQLRTYYLPDDNITRAMSLLRNRIDKNKYGSVLIPHQGRLKRGFTQNDYCMIGTTLTYYPKEKGIHWTTHWRSTEAIKRSRGDFLLIQYMLDEMEDMLEYAPILEYTFKFDTLTFHPMMVPLALPYIKWQKWMKAIKKHDQLLYRDILRWFAYYFDNPGETYKRYSSAHQVHKIVHRQLRRKDIERITSYATKHGDGGPRG